MMQNVPTSHPLFRNCPGRRCNARQSLPFVRARPPVGAQAPSNFFQIFPRSGWTVKTWWSVKLCRRCFVGQLCAEIAITRESADFARLQLNSGEARYYVAGNFSHSVRSFFLGKF